MSQLVEDRRALHRIPELGLTLPKTMEYLRAALAGLGCRVFSPMESALCAWFDFGADHAIAFRADADALPIGEKNQTPYCSAHPGRMHACGHDGHMAMALELARRLDGMEKLHHNVLLIFQPAEETTGGALPICKTGILETYKVKAIFAIHLWPGLTKNVLFSRRHEMMSRSSQLDIDIHGLSAHIAKPKEGCDALAAAVELYRLVRQRERSLPGDVYRLLNFGLFHSGRVCNAVSAHTRMEGSMRAFSDDVFEWLRTGVREAAKTVEETYGCTVELHFHEGYPAVWNPGDLYDRVAQTLAFSELDEPSMTTEDFSWYQRFVPGMLFFLGLGDVPALHADTFDFDESALAVGADFLEELAVKFHAQ